MKEKESTIKEPPIHREVQKYQMTYKKVVIIHQISKISLDVKLFGLVVLLLCFLAVSGEREREKGRKERESLRERERRGGKAKVGHVSCLRYLTV